MSSIELTSSQQMILQELVDRYRDTESAVKGQNIADGIDRNPGTIRNQMQSLKALQLVEGVPGPKGGYKPTASAYDVLDLQEVDEPESVPLVHDGERIEHLNVQAINLNSVHHPEKCSAEIQVQGSIRDVHEGDTITVGPTPKSRLVITGQVDGLINSDNLLVLKISTMKAPAEA